MNVGEDRLGDPDGTIAACKQRIIAALEALPTDERDVITVAVFSHLSYRQVARGLRIPEGATRAHLRSGLARLRRDLAGVDWSTSD